MSFKHLIEDEVVFIDRLSDTEITARLRGIVVGVLRHKVEVRFEFTEDNKKQTLYHCFSRTDGRCVDPEAQKTYRISDYHMEKAKS